MYTAAKTKKLFRQAWVLFVLLPTLLEGSWAESGRPEMVHYWERILLENKFSVDTPEQLLEATKSESYFLRYVALHLLTDRMGDKAIPMLRQALADAHVRVRWTAAHLLSSLGEKTGLEQMKLDFAELVPRNGAPKPIDPNITSDPQSMTRWQRDRLYRIRRALEVGKVLAELGDRRGYELAAMTVLEDPLAANRLRAVKVLAEIAKTEESVLAAEGKDPAFVLSSVAESEKGRTVFIEVVISATRLGGRIGLPILEKAKDNPYQAEREIRMAKHGLDSLKTRTKAAEKNPKE
jgi:hypothetical protein